MNRSRPLLIDALRAADPAAPPPPEAYVDRTAPGSERWDRADQLRVLVEAGQRFRILLHGAVGVGKSSELDAWQRALVGLRVGRVAGGEYADQGQLHELLTSRWRLERFDLALVDGLDRAPVHELFGPGTLLVDPALPPVVYVAPHLLAKTPATDRDPGFDQVWHLPPFPVLAREGVPRWDTVRYLGDGLMRRLGDSAGVFERAGLFERAALASGGVPPARPARTEDELRRGELALRRALATDSQFEDAHQGEVVAVDRLTERLFSARPDASALDVARESLDEGVLYLVRLPVAAVG